MDEAQCGVVGVPVDLLGRERVLGVYAVGTVIARWTATLGHRAPPRPPRAPRPTSTCAEGREGPDAVYGSSRRWCRPGGGDVAGHVGAPPPLKRSAPDPPDSRSPLLPPPRLSSPAPLDRMSLPLSPHSRSLPSPPVSVSLLPGLGRRSAPVPPVSVSLPLAADRDRNLDRAGGLSIVDGDGQDRGVAAPVHGAYGHRPGSAVPAKTTLPVGTSAGLDEATLSVSAVAAFSISTSPRVRLIVPDGHPCRMSRRWLPSQSARRWP